MNSCRECGATGFVVFYLPGEWKGGLCEGCARRLHGDAFAGYFGEVSLVSDGDAGKGNVKT